MTGTPGKLSSLEQLKSLRDDYNLKDKQQRYQFLRQFYHLSRDWEGQLPNLRDIFQEEEIDRLLEASVDGRSWRDGDNFINFVIRTGYKDEPKVDEDGNPLLRRTTAVHRAVHKNFFLASNIFEIYNRFDLNYTDESGLTHFHAACTFLFCKESINKFLEAGHDPNQLYKKTGESPLHFALKHKSRLTAALLLEAGANPNLANKNGLTPAHLVCLQYRDWTMDMIFSCTRDQHRPVQVNARTNLGNTPLHLALENGHEYLVRLLMENGADPNEANNEGSTCLHVVCGNSRKYPELTESFFTLVDCMSSERRCEPIQIDARDKLGNRPLHLALKNGHKDLVRWLLKKGADPNAANDRGSTPLHMISERDAAWFYGVKDLVELFFEINDELRQVVLVDARDKLGRTPLQLAVANFSPDVLDALLKKGANVSSFIFPKEFSYKERFERYDYERPHDFPLRSVSGALAVLASLEHNGYELTLDEALKIMEIFDEIGFAESMDLEDRWDDGAVFVDIAKVKMIRPSLSLYDLLQTRFEKAAKLLTPQDYFELMSSKNLLSFFSAKTVGCIYFKELMARKFFRRWAIDSFWKLLNYRLPLECCEMVIDDSVMNKTLYHICLAYKIGQKSSRE